MNIFFKSNNHYLFKNSKYLFDNDIIYPKELSYQLGIDGSTTSFGVAWFNEQCINLLMLMRDMSEDRKTFMEKVFPFLQRLFYGITFDTVTYERTPDDFSGNDAHSVQIMKDTEKAIGNFVRNTYYISVSNQEYIFDIFPNLWKSYVVPKNIELNAGKVNKRENAIGVLTHKALDVKSWLKEADFLNGHSYDCFEALGIGIYGSEFIKSEPFMRTYRNFTRRRPLILLSKLVPEEQVIIEIETLFNDLGNLPMLLFKPNEIHSAFENLYALDNDNHIGVLITERNNSLSPYLQHISGVCDAMKNEVLVNATLRVNELNKSRIKKMSFISNIII